MISWMACAAGFILDFIFGDPRWLYHPVRIIGALVGGLEKGARKLCGKSEKKLLAAGIVLWVTVIFFSTAIPIALLILAGSIHPYVRFALEGFWCYQLLAAKSLKQESLHVYKELKKGSLIKARKAVSMIVGRDTESLNEEGVIKAAVETVAENTSDGVIAPLFYMMIGGAPLGFLYKAANTMDSMIGYKDETYLYLGKCAARMDDVFNFLPARLSALFMTAAAFFLGLNGKNAWRIYLRDKRKHASPNAAQTEAVCAGALGVQLAGDAWYFGKRYHKEYIGDNKRPVEDEDIVRACKLLYGTAILAFVFFGTLKLCFLLL